MTSGVDVPAAPSLTLGVWNCRMGVRRKLEPIRRLGCDVLVVPECGDITDGLGEEIGFEWKGRYPRKGLGVFAFHGWSLERIRERDTLPWVLPLRLTSPIGVDAGALLATWTVQNHAEKWPSYAGQVTAAIDHWSEELERGRTILAGDVNCSLQGPSAAPHLANLQRLASLGVRSAYHTDRGVEPGAEPEMTLRWIGRGGLEGFYHCDLVLVSSQWRESLSRVEIGAMEDWVANGLSDHVPVVVRFAGEAIGQVPGPSAERSDILESTPRPTSP